MGWEGRSGQCVGAACLAHCTRIVSESGDFSKVFDKRSDM